MKKILTVLLLVFSFNVNLIAGDIYLHLLTTGQPASTYYLGDVAGEYFINFEVGQTWWFATDVGIGTLNTGIGENWETASWYEDGSGNNKRVRADIAGTIFNNTGFWYFYGRAKAEEGDSWHYANNGTWGNAGSLNATEYFTVNALSNPTSPSATAASSSQINLSWTQWNGKNVMILRKKSNQSWTEPTQGVSYAVDENIGDAVVVYNGAGTSFNSVSLASSTEYNYKFYSVNNDYYSEGTVVSESTQTAATDRFRSKVDGNWTDASTWESSSDNSIWVNATLNPTSTATSIIIANAVILTTDETASALTISASKSLTINSGKSLTVTGTLTNNAGATGLVIKSDASGTGSLIHNSDNVAANMQRYMSGSETWRLVSSPVENQVIIDVDNWTPTGTYEGGHGYDFYAYDEETATWLNQKVGANSITSFTPGVGYLVSLQLADQTKDFEDDLNNGNIPVTVSRANSGDYAGANLIGNPFPSGIDWFSAIKELFEDDFAYVYDRVSTELGVTEGYRTVNGGSAGAYIAANQGFFVIKSTVGSGTFTFTNSMRVHNGTFYKSQTNIDQLVLRITNGSYYDETMLAVSEEATFNRDRADAIKMFSYNVAMPQIYTMTEDNRQVMINSMPNIDVEKTIAMGAVIPVVGEYTIKLTEIGESFVNKVIFLKDLKTGLLFNLTEDGEYTFTSEEGDDTDRFEIHFGVVGINEPGVNSTLRAYVSHGQLTILGETGELNVDVLDMQGRVLERRAVQMDGSYSQPLNLPAGVYVVRVYNGQAAKSVKVILTNR